MSIFSYFRKIFIFRKSLSFSFLEGLLVIAILGIIFSLSTIAFIRFQKTYELKTTANELFQNLKRAQAKAMSQEQDKNWGIKFEPENKKYYLCSDNCTTNLETFTYSTNINLTSSLNPIIFQKLSGTLTTAGTINLNLDSQTKTITITTAGLIILN
ncbi:MAG: hypothetical protein N2259_02465 [Patescibacteria group bacterium]|nr:hypothetical protein [Patescibacteria group bacterium]